MIEQDNYSVPIAKLSFNGCGSSYGGGAAATAVTTDDIDTVKDGYDDGSDRQIWRQRQCCQIRVKL